MPKKITNEDFIKAASEKHNNVYNYTKVNYVNNRTKITISCSVHGDFEQKPNNHLNGQGCIKCAKHNLSIYKTKSNEQFIKEAIEVQEGKYDYSKTEYKNGSEKAIITCRLHGDFKQTPDNHLRGQGCPKCGKESHWRRSDYIKKAKGRFCTFYVIGCFNESEGFYKIGITMNSVEKRYNHTKRMPYNYQIVSEIRGEAGFIWDLELQEKRKLKEFHYRPKIEFKGSITECFTKYKYERK